MLKKCCMLILNVKSQSKHVPRGFSFLYFSATLLSRGLSNVCEIHVYSRENWTLRAIDSREERSLFIVHIANTARKTDRYKSQPI